MNRASSRSHSVFTCLIESKVWFLCNRKQSNVPLVSKILAEQHLFVAN